MIIYLASHISYASFVNTYYVNEGMSSITFVWRSLYPKGYNASKDEGTLTFNIMCCLVLKPKHLRTSHQQPLWIPDPEARRSN
jgi:hypothetical protein